MTEPFTYHEFEDREYYMRGNTVYRYDGEVGKPVKFKDDTVPFEPHVVRTWEDIDTLACQRCDLPYTRKTGTDTLCPRCGDGHEPNRPEIPDSSDTSENKKIKWDWETRNVSPSPDNYLDRPPEVDDMVECVDHGGGHCLTNGTHYKVTKILSQRELVHLEELKGCHSFFRFRVINPECNGSRAEPVTRYLDRAPEVNDTVECMSIAPYGTLYGVIGKTYVVSVAARLDSIHLEGIEGSCSRYRFRVINPLYDCQHEEEHCDFAVDDWVVIVSGCPDNIKGAVGIIKEVPSERNDERLNVYWLDNHACQPVNPEAIEKLSADDGFNLKTGKFIRDMYKGYETECLWTFEGVHYCDEPVGAHTRRCIGKLEEIRDEKQNTTVENASTNIAIGIGASTLASGDEPIKIGGHR